MEGKAKREDREKADKRRARFWKTMALPVEAWLRSRFGFSHDDFEPAGIDGPVLVCINHACAYDPIFTGIAFKNKRLSFIASEHILRMPKWGPLINKYLSIIPHHKGARGSRTALIAMKRIKRGESVFLAPEGEQTWNGRPLSVMPYTGRLVKGSGATLVTYMIEGGYLSAPRWAMSTRKGRVYSHVVNVYGPERLSEMSDEEVEAAIAADLAFDTWKWQKSQAGGPVRYKCKKGGNADGLERLVFTCPECGRMDTLHSAGDYIGCGCGFRLRLTDTGFFEKYQGDGASDSLSDGRGCFSSHVNGSSGACSSDLFPSGIPHFDTVCDWENFDRESLRKLLEDCPEELFGDDDVTLVRIEDDHSETEAAHGRLTLQRCNNTEAAHSRLTFERRSGSGNGKRGKDGQTAGPAAEVSPALCIGEYSFDLAGISNMTMILAARVVFSDKSGYYELRSAKGSRTNLRKYVIARSLI